jgi:hypothetical protein
MPSIVVITERTPPPTRSITVRREDEGHIEHVGVAEAAQFFGDQSGSVRTASSFAASTNSRSGADLRATLGKWIQRSLI